MAFSTTKLLSLLLGLEPVSVLFIGTVSSIIVSHILRNIGSTADIQQVSAFN